MVITKQDRKGAILWAIDYGKPALTITPENLIQLPEKIREYQSLIFQAGLPLIPATEIYDSESERLKVVACDEWEEETIEFFKKCIRESSVCYFRQSPDIRDEEISFGELIIQKPSGEVFELSQKLCEMKLALREAPSGERFLNVFNRSISAVIDRWNDNARSGGVCSKPDMLMITEIAEPCEVEMEKLRKLKLAYVAAKKKRDEFKEFNNSIAKCNSWCMRNDLSPQADEHSSGDSPSTSRSPQASTSSARLLEPMSQIRANMKKLSVNSNAAESLEMTLNPASSSGMPTRPSFRKMIVVPAGIRINTNSGTPTFVVDECESIEDDAEQLNALPEEPQSSTTTDDSSDNRNSMQLIVRSNRRHRSDCCTSQ